MKSSSQFRGPSLVLLGFVHIALFVANLVAAAALRHGAPYVNPYASGEVVHSFFAENAKAVQISSFFLFASAVPFGLFAATVVSRLRFLQVRAAGTDIAFFGGFSASLALALSGIFGWVLSLPDVAASVPVVRALYFLSFLFGGTGFAVAFGLLVLGVSVSCYFARLLPGWLTVLGMLVGYAGELSSFSLVSYPVNYLIPITRYLGLIWLLAVAIKLPASRTLLQVQRAAVEAA